MSGFIVLDDGRAWSASNWAIDAVLRATACQLADNEFRAWLLHQQGEFVGVGMTRVDLRELTPHQRATFCEASRRAFRQAQTQGFEQLTPGSEYYPGWLDVFAELVARIEQRRAGGPATDACEA